MTERVPKFKTEVELAMVVARWGEALGYDVYKEVATGDGDCDLVFVQGPLVWVIECKLRLSDELLLQATRRLSFGHHVSVAVPDIKGELGVSKEFYLEQHGIGLLLVDHPETGMWRSTRVWQADGSFTSTSAPAKEPNWEVLVGARIEPSVHRHTDLKFSSRYPVPEPNRTVMVRRIAELRRFLSPEHKLLVAGGRGGQLTPWRKAKLRVKKILADHGPQTTVEIYDHLCHDHPWLTRRAAIAAIGRMCGDIARKEFTRVTDGGVGKWALPVELGGEP